MFFICLKRELFTFVDIYKKNIYINYINELNKW